MNSALDTPFPLEQRTLERLSEAVTEQPASGLSRTLYLDLAERIVRGVQVVQTPDGCILDPYEALHPDTCTPRFVGAVAGLPGGGRAQDPLDSVQRAFDWSVRDLLSHRRPGPILKGADFSTKELGFGYELLRRHLPPRLLAAWREGLRACPPELIHTDLPSWRSSGLANSAWPGECDSTIA